MVFGVETVRWFNAAKMAGTWYRGILTATERLMARWYVAKAELSRQRLASAVGGVQGNAGWGGWGAGRVTENQMKGMRR